MPWKATTEFGTNFSQDLVYNLNKGLWFYTQTSKKQHKLKLYSIFIKFLHASILRKIYFLLRKQYILIIPSEHKSEISRIPLHPTTQWYSCIFPFFLSFFNLRSLFRGMRIKHIIIERSLPLDGVHNLEPLLRLMTLR